MRKVLMFEDYVKNDRFNTQVTLPLLEKNPIYETLQEGNEGIAFLHFHLYVYVFLKYVPNGTATHLPSVEDSFNKITINNRISKGEWVIENFYRLKKEDALSIYPLIYTKEKQTDWLPSLKQVIQNKSVGQSFEKTHSQYPSF